MTKNIDRAMEQAMNGVSIRQSQHHGFFYPADPGLLIKQLDDYLSAVSVTEEHLTKALVVPHAGYDYSARVAASAYAVMKNEHWIKRIVILAPNHQTTTSGGLICSHNFWVTPLGRVTIDRRFMAQSWEALDCVTTDDSVHQVEYSIEVQLPFIQRVLPDVPIVPILLGECTPQQITDIVNPAWQCTQTLIIISSDLYHYLPRAAALPTGMVIVRAIESNNIDAISAESACGYVALTGLMKLVQQAKSHYWRTLAVSHSGADNRFAGNSLVGYGAFLLLDPSVNRLSD